MLEAETLIKLLNKECKSLFFKNFLLVPISGHHNISTYRIEGDSLALNRFELPYEPVKVLSWFEDFWIFLEIKFISKITIEGRKKIKEIHTYISLSVFQGESNDPMKYQLFRAEWDDLKNINEIHSQPHWHITSNQAIEKTFEEYSNTFDNGDFISELQNIKKKVFDVNQIHFAMNGNWQSNESHIHTIDDGEKVARWLKGMLGHLRVELQSKK